MSGDFESLVPYFIVYINGTRIAVEQEASVKQIIVTDRIDAPSVCRIIMSDPDRAWADSSELVEGQQVSVHLGTKDDIDEVFNGEIVGMRAQYNRDTDDVTTIICRNALHRLKSTRRTVHYSEMSDSDIIMQIASDHNLGCECEDLTPVHQLFIQNDTTDYDMVMHLAERHGCTVWAADGTVNVSSEPVEAEEIVIEWEKTLIEFDATMDTSDIVSEVEVRGWDTMVGEEVSGIADTSAITSVTGEGEIGGAVVEEAFGPATVTVTDPKAVDQATAEELALDTITKNSYQLVTGNGRAEGNYSIKAGATVEVKELGGRFSGLYILSEVTHRFVSSVGYTTSFAGTRNTI